MLVCGLFAATEKQKKAIVEARAWLVLADSVDSDVAGRNHPVSPTKGKSLSHSRGATQAYLPVCP